MIGSHLKMVKLGEKSQNGQITITNRNVNHQITKLYGQNHQITTLFWGKSPSPPLLRITKSPLIVGLNHQITTHFWPWPQTPITTNTCSPFFGCRLSICFPLMERSSMELYTLGLVSQVKHFQEGHSPPRPHL